MDIDRRDNVVFRKDFYLCAGNTLADCSFVSRFIEEFKESEHFRGVLLAEEKPPDSVLHGRKVFHAEYGGQQAWNDALEQKWLGLYPPLNESNQRMIHLNGLPKFALTHHPNTIFLGPNVNGNLAKESLNNICEKNTPWLVTYVSKILKPWWISITKNQILNCHSAVLPYARGVHSIENVAALRDVTAFRQAAGITVHYIDAGVDTGPIIRAERVIDPFRFDSIWELKAHLFTIGIEWYVQTIKDLLGPANTMPAGIIHHPHLRGPNYMRKDFTPEKRRQAEEGYLWMKSQVENNQGK